ncbi:MAG: DUF1109 family protein [Bradyrhizobium sp.]|nr:MAG: DUF1109 family protein [Bradyrhizobium sp.]
MKTADLIKALAAEPIPEPIRLGRRVALSLALGAAISAALFMALLGPRHDIIAAAHTMRFDLKFIDTLALLAPSALLALRLLRPDAEPGALFAALIAPFVLLGGAVIVELIVTPADLWMTRLMGTNALHCLTLIPLMSIPPLAALIYAMRAGAPAYPALTGALAGAAAAGVAATIYATNCTDDSPLFVASWYPLATLVVVVAGALAGRKWLQW